MARWVGIGTQQPRAGFEPVTLQSQVWHCTIRPWRTSVEGLQSVWAFCFDRCILCYDTLQVHEWSRYKPRCTRSGIRCRTSQERSWHRQEAWIWELRWLAHITFSLIVSWCATNAAVTYDQSSVGSEGNLVKTLKKFSYKWKHITVWKNDPVSCIYFTSPNQRFL